MNSNIRSIPVPELMSEYKCFTPSKISIELKDLLFDERVADLLESFGTEFPSSLENNLFDDSKHSMDYPYLSSILDRYDDGSLTAVKVEKVWGDRYKVVKGKYKVCASILKGATSVPCRICQ